MTPRAEVEDGPVQIAHFEKIAVMAMWYTWLTSSWQMQQSRSTECGRSTFTASKVVWCSFAVSRHLKEKCLQRLADASARSSLQDHRLENSTRKAKLAPCRSCKFFCVCLSLLLHIEAQGAQHDVGGAKR
jgi:hypothetical protein